MKHFNAVFAVLMFFLNTACAQITEKGKNMNKPEITLKECFYAEKPAENWEKGIPANAKKIDFAFGRILDFDKIAAKAGKCMDECAVYIRFTSTGTGTLSFGLGADWWAEGFINGTPCLSTMQTGNGTTDYSVCNNPFAIPVKEGENILAVKIRRGSSGWKFVCGPTAYEPYAGKIPWEKGPVPESAAVRSGKSYRLIVLGDLHFDTDEKIYHSDYNEPDANLNRIQRSEFARNAAMWKERNPRMITAAASKITPETLAVIQVGDLIQGDCGNPEVHSKMLLDMLGYLKKEFKGLPVLTVTGNHDIRGTGAEEAYHKSMPAYHSRELKQTVAQTNFYTFLGGDLFLFIDFNAPDIEVITEALNQKARYKFVISHGPVLPASDASYRWFLYGQNDQWRRLTHQLFMREDVIVLTGHVHDLELTECVTVEGRITQLMANSVWSAEKLAEYETVYSKPSEYGIEVNTPDAKQLFGEYKNVITRYWKAKGAGYFVLDVTPSGITAKYYGGDSVKPSKEIKLR